MLIEILVLLHIYLIHHIQADEKCYYRNGTNIIDVDCPNRCCLGTATSAQAACCSSLAWRLVAPIVIIVCICLILICLGFFRPFFKVCCQRNNLSRQTRSRVTTPNRTPVNTNPIFIIDNHDLPDYETVTKDSSTKDVIPPSYNFVAAHPSDFDIEAHVPNAPPQYHELADTVDKTELSNARI